MRLLFQISNASNEWVLLEMQGNLSSRTHHTFQGLKLGKLLVNKTVATLQIGNHLLEGKVQLLSKPFMVCETQKKKDHDIYAATQHENYEANILVHAIVKKKIVFNHRPTPIVNASHNVAPL